jgi:8-oxo-dGTP diphosphatase
LTGNNREYPARPIVGVGGVVIEGGKALLIRRGAPPMAGEWSIPGGTLELGETLEQGVRRELSEETGLKIRVLALIEAFGRIFRDEQGRVQYHYVILDYLCQRISGTERAANDALDVAWVSEEELSAFSLAPKAIGVLRKAFEMARHRPTFISEFRPEPPE